VQWECPLPTDFESLLAALREDIPWAG